MYVENDVGLEIAKGNVPKHTTGTIFGRNEDIDPAAEELIWDYGGVETYLTADTELFLSSTSASDTNVTMLVKGMTDDFVVKNEVHTLVSGQSQQSIGNWFRIFIIIVVAGNAPLGEIFCAEADTLSSGEPNTATKVHALMPLPTNITHKCLSTVPAGHTMYVTRLFMGVRRGEDAVIQFRSRASTAPDFVLSSSFPLYQSSEFLTFDPPFVLLEKTDFEFTASTVTNNTQVTANLGFILVDNSA